MTKKVVKKSPIKILKKRSSKVIRRGSVKIVCRAIPTFQQAAMKMKKRQLLQRLFITFMANPTLDNPTSSDKPEDKIIINILKLYYSMSMDDINRSIRDMVDNRNMRENLSLYYHGDLSADEIIRNWGHKGLISEEKVRSEAMKGTYNIPQKIGYQLKWKDKSGHFYSNPEGQRPLDQGTSQNLYEFLIKLKAISNPQIINKIKWMYLMDIADNRPEYAAVVSYIINGGNRIDDFSKMRSKFNLIDPVTKQKYVKEKFMQDMKEYLLYKSHDPQFKAQRALENQIRKEELIKNEEFHKKRLEAYHNPKILEKKNFGSLNMDEHLSDYHIKNVHVLKDSLEKPDTYYNTDEIYGQKMNEDDNDDDDNLRRKRKMKMIAKRRPVKIIRKKKNIRKCRCN